MNPLVSMRASALGLSLLALCGASYALNPASMSLDSGAQAPAERAAARVGGRVHVNVARVGLDTYANLCTEAVHGRVLDVQARFPAGRIARTAYTLEVYGALKGLDRNRIEVEVAGAKSDEVTIDVPSAPRFEIGEEVVLFLWTEPTTGETGILGLADGVYRVKRDAEGAPRVAGIHGRGETPASFLDRAGDLIVRDGGRMQGGR